MEKKIMMMQKILTVLLLSVLGVWSLITGDFKGPAAYFGLLLIAAVGYTVIKKNKEVDEREMQIHLAASYASFIITICFIFVMQTLEYVKYHSTSKIYGIILAVMMLSQLAGALIFRKTSK